MDIKTQEHQRWLDEMKEKSKKKQESFMNNISKRLGHARLNEAPKHPFRGAPDFWQEMSWNKQDRIDKFTENFKAVGGHVASCKDIAEVAQFIADKAQEMGAQRILRQDQALLSELGLEQKLQGVITEVWNQDAEKNWIQEAAQADFGIVQADYAVAYTGSVVATSAKHKGRSVSLLPTVLFLIIPTSILATTLGEVLTTFDERGRADLPAGIHFISGPSRSSDIENDLTIGVHGPGVVFAVLLEDE